MDIQTLAGLFILIVFMAGPMTSRARDNGEDVSYFTMFGILCMVFGVFGCILFGLDYYKTKTRLNEKIENSTFVIEYNINCELADGMPATYCPHDSIKYIEAKFDDINWSLRKLERQLDLPFKTFWIDSTTLVHKIERIIKKETYSDILKEDHGWYGDYRPYKFYEYKIYEKRK